MAISNNDRVSSLGLNRVVSALWTKIKNTFPLNTAVVHNTGAESIAGTKTFTSEIESTASGANNAGLRCEYPVGETTHTLQVGLGDGNNGLKFDGSYAVKYNLSTGAVTFTGGEFDATGNSSENLFKVLKPGGTTERVTLSYFNTGDRGLWDSASNAWVVKIDSNNDRYFYGTASTATQATKATGDDLGNNIRSTYATKSELTNGLGTKQDTLTAGDNITISGTTIYASGVLKTGGTDQNVWGVKTFKTNPIIKANSGSSALQVERSDSTANMQLSYRTNGERCLYDSASGRDIFKYDGTNVFLENPKVLNANWSSFQAQTNAGTSWYQTDNNGHTRIVNQVTGGNQNTLLDYDSAISNYKFYGVSANSQKWNGFTASYGEIPDIANMQPNTFYISD